MSSKFKGAPLDTAPYPDNKHRHFDAPFIRNQAQSRWPSILAEMGIDRKFLQNKHGPCPHCGGRDRFRFDDRDGRGTFYCNHCGSGDGFRLVQLVCRCNFPAALEHVAQQLGLTGQLSVSPSVLPVCSYATSRVIHGRDNAEYRRNLIIKTLNETRPVKPADPVSLYPAGRNLLPADLPTDLRFHPALSYYDDSGTLVGKYPAMIGVIRDKDGRVVTLHRTYLGRECKADVPSPKKMMSPPLQGQTTGTAIRLYMPTAGVLAVGEGIETALAYWIATGLPAWAAVSANGLEHVVLPMEVKETHILVDNDHSGTGQRVAGVLAMRLLQEGRRVRRIMPPTVGQDIADLMVRRCL